MPASARAEREVDVLGMLLAWGRDLHSAIWHGNETNELRTELFKLRHEFGNYRLEAAQMISQAEERAVQRLEERLTREKITKRYKRSAHG